MERNWLVASGIPPNRDGSQPRHGPTRPDQESNWRTFGLLDDAQPTMPHQSGQFSF